MASTINLASRSAVLPAKASSRSRCVRVHAVASEQQLQINKNGVSSGAAADWGPTSWRNRVALQQPAYPDAEAVKQAYGEIASYPPLIFAGECRNLQDRLAKVANGEAFILMVGGCGLAA
jgi:3-deoxy-7-phosphoheptulonate synthase